MEHSSLWYCFWHILIGIDALHFNRCWCFYTFRASCTFIILQRNIRHVAVQTCMLSGVFVITTEPISKSYARFADPTQPSLALDFFKRPPWKPWESHMNLVHFVILSNKKYRNSNCFSLMLLLIFGFSAAQHVSDDIRKIPGIFHDQNLQADNLPAERLEELNRALDEYILRCLVSIWKTLKNGAFWSLKCLNQLVVY